MMANKRKTAPSTALVFLLVVVVWTVLLIVDTTTTTTRISSSPFLFVAAVLDAETGGDCVDSDPVNCPFWAATGECQNNKKHMHVHCKKSCDRCNVVRVNNRNEINRYIEERKQELEAKRELRKKEQEALEALRGGGALESGETKKQQQLPPPQQDTANAKAKATTTATVSSDGSIVVDEVPKQQSESRAEVVSNTKPIVAQTTTATSSSSSSSPSSSSSTGIEKKKVKIDANTGLECVDLNENCPFWAAEGECRNNRKYMFANCRLSCDRCHIIRANSANDMHRIIGSKQKETERVLHEKRQARNVQKILQGEL